ncbi:MAG TPA: HAMP domain-containing histidine kinase [Clostridiales bacterium]|nr:HAMP domain-containing histidine kinase [Clostridiales bacterium]
MFKKLQNKLLMMNMIITSIVILGAFAIVYLTTYSNIVAENERKLKALSGAALTIHSSGEDGDTLLPPPVSSEGSSNISHVTAFSPAEYSPSFTVLVSADGEIVNIDSFIDMPQEVYAQAVSLTEKDKSNKRIDFYDRSWIYTSGPYTVNVISDNGQADEISDGSYRIAFLDITDTQKTLLDLLLTFLLVGAGVLVVVFFISLYFAKRSIKPIAEAWEKQRQFVADASHELKTPLSVVNANYDALVANEDETIKSQREWLDYIKYGTDRMSKLVNNLLFLANMDGTSGTICKAQFDISRLIENTIMPMEPIIREKEIAFTRMIEPDILIASDADLVEQVFTILLDNALKYTDKAGAVEVVLRRSKNQVVCTIKNSGKGIAQQDMDKVFDRFYRGDPSRSGDGNGFGLGLSIAKSAISRLGGEIFAESVENEWTAFTFSIVI